MVMTGIFWSSAALISGVKNGSIRGRHKNSRGLQRNGVFESIVFGLRIVAVRSKHVGLHFHLGGSVSKPCAANCQ